MRRYFVTLGEVLVSVIVAIVIIVTTDNELVAYLSIPVTLSLMFWAETAGPKAVKHGSLRK